MATSKSATIAQGIIDECNRLGWAPEVRGNILRIRKSFKPNDSAAYAQCDMEYGCIFDLLPRTRPGSDWGTDGSGIGGYAALGNGQFVMNRSGGSARVLNSLRKML